MQSMKPRVEALRIKREGAGNDNWGYSSQGMVGFGQGGNSSWLDQYDSQNGGFGTYLGSGKTMPDKRQLRPMAMQQVRTIIKYFIIDLLTIRSRDSFQECVSRHQAERRAGPSVLAARCPTSLPRPVATATAPQMSAGVLVLVPMSSAATAMAALGPRVSALSTTRGPTRKATWVTSVCLADACRRAMRTATSCHSRCSHSNSNNQARREAA
jgi:hypothetical protein